MYRWFLIVHSLWRWLVLVPGFAAVLSAALRVAASPTPLPPSDPRLGRAFSIAVDIQVLIGAALYLSLSPLTHVVARSASVPLPTGSQARFFIAIHPLFMIAAFVAVHVASVLIRRAGSDAARERRIVMGYGAALTLILLGTPWWRPWARF